MEYLKLGTFLMWNGIPATIIGKAFEPTVIIELLEDKRCENCGHCLGKHQFSIIPTSPLFKENAKPIESI